MLVLNSFFLLLMISDKLELNKNKFFFVSYENNYALD